jgi:hypothetical protein
VNTAKKEAKMKHADSRSAVSFLANVARLPQKGLPVVIEADAGQRVELASEHDLLSVENYRAELLVERWKRNGVKVSGRVEADITQACIVTLDPIKARIDEPVEALFLPEASKLGRQGFEGPRKQGVALEATGDAEPVENEFQQKLRSLLGKS